MSSKICPRFHNVATTIIEKDGKSKRLLIRLGCRQWQCPVCYKRNRELWRHHLMQKVSEIGGAWSFWTITMPSFIHKASSDEKRAKLSLFRIRDNWDKFMKFMKRKYGKFEYVRVFETHESGCLHIHFLASFHVPDEDYKTAHKGTPKEYSYSASMKDVIKVSYNFGEMHSVINLPIDDFAKAVGYATKYMTKEDDFVAKYLGKTRVRRIQTSRKIGAVPKSKSDYDWSIVQGVSKYEAKDIETIDLHKSKVLRDSDFEGGLWYPTTREIMETWRIFVDKDDEL
jgi:hypothetical protein